MQDFLELLRSNPYPGRGIMVGNDVVYYWIMGRSENSRNRVFVEKGNELFTEPYDYSKVSDPSLIIYSAIRKIDERTIVTNGDQTDTIYNFMSKGKCMRAALRTRV